MNNDKYFFICWEDSDGNQNKVGVLARINDIYYLKSYNKKPNNERNAYSRGYKGLPGFITGRLYKSTNKLFDFFLNRIFIDNNEKGKVDCLEELQKTKAKIQTDSFSIMEIPERYREKFKKIILAIDSENKNANNAKKVSVGPDK